MTKGERTTKGLPQDWRTEWQSAVVLLLANIGLEFLNKVLFSTRDFYNTALKRKYQQLTISKTEIGNANHYSIRKPAVDKIFEMLKN